MAYPRTPTCSKAGRRPDATIPILSKPPRHVVLARLSSLRLRTTIPCLNPLHWSCSCWERWRSAVCTSVGSTRSKKLAHFSAAVGFTFLTDEADPATLHSFHQAKSPPHIEKGSKLGPQVRA